MNDFGSVARRELPGLLRYGVALCGDPELGRGIVQDVLVRAFQRWDRIGDLERPAAYLTRRVTNEFLSWRRRWSTRTIMLAEDGELDRAASVADPSVEPTERADLEHRPSRLPRRQQDALVVRFYEGLEYAEVAAVLGCAEGTAQSLCSRGLANLRLDDSAPTPTRREIR